ncbi:hypothetical protein [Jeotgalibacillus salarius]|uniref:hypothetical protein n=1 Tax=Jeotgalibacillus salarius TaxID=546023 RepID=UPI001FC83D7C|nr:hypothetical protein [Jeotgalibacillus salarius]
MRDHANIKKGLNEIYSEDELLFNPHDISIATMGLAFNFFRRWLIYLLAVIMTESMMVLMISIVLFIVSLYDILFNYTLEKLRKANIGLYVIIADVIYISIFVIYIFLRM